MADDSDGGRRKSRSNQVQMMELFKMVEENNLLHIETLGDRVLLRKKWNEIAAHLNQLGPNKSSNDWKEAFRDLKNRVRKKHRIWATAQQGNGTINTNAPPLNGFEQRVFDLISGEAVDCTNLGFESKFAPTPLIMFPNDQEDGQALHPVQNESWDSLVFSGVNAPATRSSPDPLKENEYTTVGTPKKSPSSVPNSYSSRGLRTGDNTANPTTSAPRKSTMGKKKGESSANVPSAADFISATNDAMIRQGEIVAEAVIEGSNIIAKAILEGMANIAAALAR